MTAPGTLLTLTLALATLLVACNGGGNEPVEDGDQTVEAPDTGPEDPDTGQEAPAGQLTAERLTLDTIKGLTEMAEVLEAVEDDATALVAGHTLKRVRAELAAKELQKGGITEADRAAVRERYGAQLKALQQRVWEAATAVNANEDYRRIIESITVPGGQPAPGQGD